MARQKSFKKVYNGTQENQQLQTNIENAIAETLKNPLLDGRLLPATLVLGNNKLEHKLDRKVRGYIIVKKSAACDIYDISSDDLFITFASTANAAVTIWIF